MQKIRLRLWLRKKLPRRTRFIVAGISALLIIAAVLTILPALVPRFILTLGDGFSFKTPAGFSVGNMFSFSQTGDNSPELSAAAEEGKIPYMNVREIPFKYQEVINLNNQVYSVDTLLQSMDFKVGNPPANGLIQIWSLAGSIEDFLDGSTNNKEVTYQAFKSSGSEIGGMKCATWDYVFKSGGMDIHSLETFFADDKYLYRVSLFVPDKNYNSHVLKSYNDLVNSVTIR